MPTSHMKKKEKLKEYARIREMYPPKVEGYTYEMYEKDLLSNKIRYIENMAAKEPLNEDMLAKMLNSTDYIAEEKFDGIRGDLQFSDFLRSFTRNISKETGWFTENTDNIPHIRDLKYPKELYGTVLDGEYRILSGDFKDISSLMNCNWEEAILRQELTGLKPTFIAFDIIYYKGIYVAMLPLMKRKDLLADVIRALPSNADIMQSSYTDDKMHLRITDKHLTWLSDEGMSEVYPTLAKEVYCNNGAIPVEETPYWHLFSKQAWYEFILLNEGEGLMLKDKNGKYYMKRGREYTKYKKFLTRDVVILDYAEPTEIYEGKERHKWQYWGMYRQGVLEEIIEGEEPDPWTRDHHVEPITKFFAKDWIGTIIYGVIITQEELADLKKKNPKETYETRSILGTLYLIVGDCQGFDEETRQYITDHKAELIGKVIEVKGNDIMKKTGKLRHPRFLRFRYDKDASLCTWEDHMA